MQVQDRVFIVTGAGSGLGAATARMLAAAGARVLIADIDDEGGNRVAAELGNRAKFVRTDVASGESGKAAVDAAIASFGALDGLVNCAGIAPAERVVGREGPHRLETFQRVIAVNLVGSFNMIRLAADAMSRQEAGPSGERGVIVCTASVAAFEGQIAQAAYSASKAGVAGMTLPIARELARFAIRVVTIAPGIFATPMLAAMPKEVQDSLARTVPFPQRLGRPDEYAALVRHIIENEMLNGEVIRLDGALRMQPK